MFHLGRVCIGSHARTSVLVVTVLLSRHVSFDTGDTLVELDESDEFGKFGRLDRFDRFDRFDGVFVVWVVRSIFLGLEGSFSLETDDSSGLVLRDRLRTRFFFLLFFGCPSEAVDCCAKRRRDSARAASTSGRPTSTLDGRGTWVNDFEAKAILLIFILCDNVDNVTGSGGDDSFLILGGTDKTSGSVASFLIFDGCDGCDGRGSFCFFMS